MYGVRKGLPEKGITIKVLLAMEFGAIYKRTNNLWVPIILHGFIDICALPYCFTTFSGYKTISLIGLVIIYTLLGIYSIVLMKPKKR